MKARSANSEPSQEGNREHQSRKPPRPFPFTTASRVFATREVWPSPSCWCYVDAVYAVVPSMSAVRVIAASAIAAMNAAAVHVFLRAAPRSTATSGRPLGAGSGGPPPAVTDVFTPNKIPWLIRVQ